MLARSRAARPRESGGAVSFEATIARLFEEVLERKLTEHLPDIAEAVAKRLGEQQSDKDLLTVTQAAKRAGVEPDAVRQWIRDKRLRTKRTPGGRVRIAPAELERCLTPPAPIIVNEDNVEALAAQLARKAAGNG